MPTNTARPAWSLFGGGGILVAATLLFIATILEYVYWVPEGGDSPALHTVFVITFSLSLLLYVVAMFPLALGSTGSNGIVGSSLLGKVTIIGFGVLFAVAQTIYLASTYFTAPGADVTAADTAGLVIMVVQYVSAVIAGVLIVRARIATGYARWALLVAIIVGAITGGIAQSTHSFEVITVAYCISTIVQAIAGISYLLNGRSAEKLVA